MMMSMWCLTCSCSGFHMLLAGCSISGMPTLTTLLVLGSSHAMKQDTCLYPILLQPHAVGLQGADPPGPLPVELWDGENHFTKELAIEPGTLVIMDDMQATKPVWWAPASCTSPITMTRPSFIWSRTSSTRTPTTGPSASTPLTSSCSRTPVKCPRSPTWTIKCTPMASWQLPPGMPGPRTPTDTWRSTSTKNFAPTAPCFPKRTLPRQSPTDLPPRPEEAWGSVAVKTTKGPARGHVHFIRQHMHDACHGSSNLCNRSPPPAQTLPLAALLPMAHSNSSSPTVAATMTMAAAARQQHYQNHGEAATSGLTPWCFLLLHLKACRCHMHPSQGAANVVKHLRAGADKDLLDIFS